MSSIYKLYIPTLFLLGLIGAELLGADWLIPHFELEQQEMVELSYHRGLWIFIWLLGSYSCQQLLNVFFWQKWISKSMGGEVPTLLINLSNVCIFAISVAGILGHVFEMSLTGFWTTSSVFGLIIGFALRNMILDLFTGLAVNIDRPYQIGDWIEVQQRTADMNVLGKVVEINWRSTRILTEENRLVVIPNSLLTTFVVVNLSSSGLETRFETSFTLDFSVPPGRAKRIIEAAARSLIYEEGFCRDKEPHVLLRETDTIGVHYLLRFWITPWQGVTPGQATSKVITRVVDHLTQAGVTLAYPKQDHYFAEMPIRHYDTRNHADSKIILSRLSLFSSMNDRELSQVSDKMRRRFFYKGDTLIKAGEEAESMFVIVEGLLEVRAKLSAAKSDVRINELLPGHFFGEMSMLTDEPRSATIVATTDTICYEIGKEDIREVFENRPEIIAMISETIAKRKVLNDAIKKEWSDREKREETDSISKSLVTRIFSSFKFKTSHQQDQTP